MAPSNKSKLTSEFQGEKDSLRAALKDLHESVAPELVNQGAEILRKVGIREEIVSKLTNPENFVNAALEDPRLTGKDVREVKELIQKVRKDPVRFFKPALRDWLKAMPRIIAGGRHPVVSTDDEKREIINYVHKLLLSVSTGIAMQRAALHFGISRRTVQRIWKHRDKIPPK